MVRLSVTLTKEQVTALRLEAGRRNMSVTAVVRRAIDAELRRSRALEAVGAFRSSGPTDTAERHDDHLAGALAEDHGLSLRATPPRS